MRKKYYCKKCNGYHYYESNIGLLHRGKLPKGYINSFDFKNMDDRNKMDRWGFTKFREKDGHPVIARNITAIGFTRKEKPIKLGIGLDVENKRVMAIFKTSTGELEWYRDLPRHFTRQMAINWMNRNISSSFTRQVLIHKGFKLVKW